MGDAGPPTPPPSLAQDVESISGIEADHSAPLREIKVLVTGFGPFKSFLINPSWLITSALPEEILPHSSYPSDESSAIKPYRIRITINPSPVRVAYNTVSTAFPDLLAQHNPDFVLHIGMAGGRDCYSLETRGHRDGYRIKDVDDNDGFSCGELVWKREGVPDCLLVHWDEDDVLRRWEQGVEKGLSERGFLAGGSTPAPAANTTIPLPKGFTGPIRTVWGTVAGSVSRAEENRKKGVVKLSRDAGRFLCEYAFFESLSRRWIDAMRYNTPDDGKASPTSSAAETVIPDSANSAGDSSNHKRALALERLGKVAFLHVPGRTGVDDINLGVMIAEEAIRALVGSWEDGYRRDRKAKITQTASSGLKDGEVAKKFTDQNSEIDTGVASVGGSGNGNGSTPTVAVIQGEVTLMPGVGVGIEDLGRVKWKS
ncbi:hypothetical protein LTR84_007432 [Exophiala bonariae]|uniref:Uncharacterized protein n=1 Tax=Exophiala bonariae TaxID=1690606 RepID=A0AAV9N1Y9_9EURO|nr:hypothetical protein LTR84_007432 [Exophiala bonariae]